MKSHYTPEEADAILGAAIKRQPMPGDMSRQELEKLASDVGVTPEQLAAAEAEFRRSQDTEQFWEAYRVYRLRRLLTILPAILFFVLLVGLRDAHAGVAGFPLILVAVIAGAFIKVRLGIAGRHSSGVRRFADQRRRSGLPVPPEYTDYR